jgi:hypothetical protein
MKRAGELLSPFELVSRSAKAERRSKGVSPRRHREVEARLTVNDVSRPGRRTGRSRRDVASRRTRTLLSFQGPMPREGGQRKGLRSRKRPPIRQVRKRSYPNRAKTLLESQGFPCLPLGRPGECSKGPQGVKLAPQAARNGACRPAAPVPQVPRAAGRAPRRASRPASRRPGRSSAAHRSWRGRRPPA